MSVPHLEPELRQLLREAVDRRRRELVGPEDELRRRLGWLCSSCRCELEEFTLGCDTCYERAYRWSCGNAGRRRELGAAFRRELRAQRQAERSAAVRGWGFGA